MKCSCGADYSDADFVSGSIGFSLLPPCDDEPACAQEFSNACAICHTTTARTIGLETFWALVSSGEITFESGRLVAHRRIGE